MMKKTLLLVCVLMLVCAGAQAYILSGSAKNASDQKGMTPVQLGDVGTSTTNMPSPTDTTVELAVPTANAWLPGSAPGTWLYRKFQSTTPVGGWKLALWGNNFADQTAHVRFWVSNSASGSAVAGQKWGLFRASTMEEVASGIAPSGTGSESNPFIDVWLPVVNTADPANNAVAYILAPIIPEPGSVLAMLSGLVGLVGFGIRRRK